ncbi:anti sigma factor C-terminal domain-containing protein [Lactovum odontotermitis]
MIRLLMLFGAYLVVSAVIFGLVWLISRIAGRIHEKKAALAESDEATQQLNTNFKQLARRTKTKRWALTAWIAGAVVVLLAGAALTINAQWMEKAFLKSSKQAQTFLTIQSPNVRNNNLVISAYGAFSSNLHADTFKNIDGYRVDWQDFDWHIGTLGSSNDGYHYQSVSPVFQNNGYYTQGTNQKIASFFLSKADYQSKAFYGLKPTHEAQTLSKLPNHLSEVALTFDKPYTYAEIQKMIPLNLMLNWYWLGVSDPSNIKASVGTYYGLASDTDENGNPTGKLATDSYDKIFVPQVKSQDDRSSTNDFYPGEDAKKMVKKYPTLEKAKFSGVILTGRTENLAVLDKQSWAFATNVGVSTEILPYQTPVK